MATSSILKLALRSPLQACNAGLSILRGQGIHPDRVIDSHELIFVRSGRLGMFEEQRRFDVGAGQALLLRQGRRHGGTVRFPPDLSFYWIHFRTRPAGRLGQSERALRIPQLTTVSRPERLTELYRYFLDDQETGRLTVESADLLLALMLCEVAAPPQPSPADARSADSLANRAELEIRVNFHKPLSASGIAAKLRCNPDYLGRLFRKIYGCTLTAAIHRRRHQRARSLLMDGGLGINEIARACGFEDPTYFRRLFLRQEGMTPSAYRNLYVHLHINTD